MHSQCAVCLRCLPWMPTGAVRDQGGAHMSTPPASAGRQRVAGCVSERNVCLHASVIVCIRYAYSIRYMHAVVFASVREHVCVQWWELVVLRMCRDFASQRRKGIGRISPLGLHIHFRPAPSLAGLHETSRLFSPQGQSQGQVRQPAGAGSCWMVEQVTRQNDDIVSWYSMLGLFCMVA